MVFNVCVELYSVCRPRGVIKHDKSGAGRGSPPVGNRHSSHWAAPPT